MIDRIRVQWIGKVDTVNARRRMHHMTLAKINRQIRTETALLATGTVDPVDLSPARVEFLQIVEKGVVPDADACAGVAKAMLDGMVDAGWLPDDGPTHVRQVIYHAPEKGPEAGVICLVARIDDDATDVPERLVTAQGWADRLEMTPPHRFGMEIPEQGE